MDRASEPNAQNVKHNKGERDVRERSMRFADRAFTLLAVPGSRFLVFVGESLDDNAGASLTLKDCRPANRRSIC